MEVTSLTTLADFFLICSADSARQVRAVSDAIEKALSEENLQPRAVEGAEAGQWVLLDYDDLIVHVFRKEVREFYGLDKLWSDAPRIVLSDLERGGTEARPRPRRSLRQRGPGPLAPRRA